MKDWSAKLRRIRALTLKETRQILRDPSSIAIGGVFPLMMILLFGYGLSLDVNRFRRRVDEDDSSDSTALIGAFRLSPYFVVTVVHSMTEAKTMLQDRKADGVIADSVRLHPALAFGRCRSPDSGQRHGREPARIMQGYAQGPVALWSAAQAGSEGSVSAGPVIVVDRMWFNESNDSHYFWSRA
jgi:ABC-2 type transport system permease protein